jgi:hypothetical protein
MADEEEYLFKYYEKDKSIAKANPKAAKVVKQYEKIYLAEDRVEKSYQANALAASFSRYGRRLARIAKPTSDYAYILGAEPPDVLAWQKWDTVVTIKEAKPVAETSMTKFKPTDDYNILAAGYADRYTFDDIYAADRVYMDAPLEAPEEYLAIRGSRAPVRLEPPRLTIRG